MNRIQQSILEMLDVYREIRDSRDMDGGFDQCDMLNVLKSLKSRDIVDYVVIEDERYVPTDEGKIVLENGSYEYQLFSAISSDGVALDDLGRQFGTALRIGLDRAFKNRWIEIKDSRVYRNSGDIRDNMREQLELVVSSRLNDRDVINGLKRRRWIESRKNIGFRITRGPKFAVDVQKGADIDSAMIASGEWRNMSLRTYNLKSNGLVPLGGHIHPLTRLRNELCQIFIGMGFAEMPTNTFVESSFWNFDALFQPQQHPARDSQDTFFIRTPVTTTNLPETLVEDVRKVHTVGGFGSIGYRSRWDYDEAIKNVMRTHTTATSAKVLYNLAKNKESVPAKYFSIDRVFRNEAVDATHLAEFHQVEGLVVDRNLTLGDLIGILSEFFNKLGIDQLRFKPTYNPYTEPSMEIFGYHKDLDRWIEIGNSGIFRPEMLGSLGFSSDVTVIAWGLSLERPAMIKYHISNIRDLLGHQSDLSLIQTVPICFFG